MTQQPMANPGREWAANWSRRIGEAIAHHRREAGLTAQQLSDRCAELGFPISRSQIAGIESGRKEAVTVAELQVLARAIGVSPLLLLLPLGREHVTEVMPSIEAETWRELEWWLGRESHPVGGPNREWPAHSKQSTVSLFLMHSNIMVKLVDIRNRGRIAAKMEPFELEGFAAMEESTAESLRTLRKLMRSLDILPPRLPAGLLPGEDDVDVPERGTARKVPDA